MIYARKKSVLGRTTGDSGPTASLASIVSELNPQIYDYHTHLPVEVLIDNEPLSSLTRTWITPDHYKLRAMRYLGLISNDDKDSYVESELAEIWLSAVPRLVGSPLFEWTRQEIEVFFGWTLEKALESPRKFIAEANEVLSSSFGRPRELLKHSGFRALATSDEPFANPDLHNESSADGLCVKPTFRLDRFLRIDQAERFLLGIEKIGRSEQMEIRDVEDFFRALRSSLQRFHNAGCNLADAGFFDVRAEEPIMEKAQDSFQKVLSRGVLLADECLNWERVVLDFVAEFCESHDWTMQLHYGALRDLNRQLLLSAGPDAGGDSIGSPKFENLAQMVSHWGAEGALPKLIIFVSNPSHSGPVSSLSLSFFRRGVEGLVRLGPAWWFLDSASGIRENLVTQAEIGVLSAFPGMVSDSRSFFSAVRHQFFRNELTRFLELGISEGRFSVKTIEDSRLLSLILTDNPANIMGMQP